MQNRYNRLPSRSYVPHQGVHTTLTIAVKLPDYSTVPQTSKEDERASALARRAQRGDYDEGIYPSSKPPDYTRLNISPRLTPNTTDLITEQLTRTSSFLTPPRLSTLRSSFIVVVGLGGVGSHCTAALARSGVSRIRIIDFDQVTLSSLNRHALATLADVGTPKVTCVRKRLEAVAPWVQWETCNEIWRESSAQRLLGPWRGSSGSNEEKDPDGPPPDYVVDAIDNIDGKVALLKYCATHGIKIVSSMGAGCKSDPTRVFVGDISSSIEDPLSRATRRRLKILGVSQGIPVVFSTEKPGPGKASLLPLPEEEFQRGKVGELSVLPDFRARILPVLGTMPAVFGYVLANFVLLEVSGYPHEVVGEAAKARDKMYEHVLSQLQGCEERLSREVAGEDVLGLKVPLSTADVSYLLEEVFRGKSVVSGLTTRLALVRWTRELARAGAVSSEDGQKDDAISPFAIDSSTPSQKLSRVNLSSLVCMTKEEAVVHEREVLRGGRPVEDVYSREVVALVEKRMEEERAFSRYR